MSTPNPDCPSCQRLPAQVQQLAARVAELEARPEKHSGNSSKPPSSDHPHDSKPSPDPSDGAPEAGAAGKRARGGQPGHRGTTRVLLPVEAVQAVVPCMPTTCAHCATSLPGEAAPEDPAPIREQMWELPPITWEVTEFQRHARTCPHCGKRSWGERPADAPTGCLGFRAPGAVVLLTGGAQLTRRPARTLLGELLGLPLSLGALSGVEAAVSAALAPAVAEIAAVVRAASVVNCDETPWREPGVKPWLWVATTPSATLFHIDLHRDRAAFEHLLPPRPGQIKTTDRYSVYISRIPEEEHAICWGHLDREFTAWAQRPGVAGSIARWLCEETAQWFSHGHAFQSGAIDRALLLAWLEPVQRAVGAALAWGEASGVPKFKSLCGNLLDRWGAPGALWATFAHVEGVEPTNNAAERAVRQGVLWRKVSLFTQSERGRQFVERVLTVKTTLRQQGRNLLEFFTESLRAARTGGEAPRVFAAGTS